MSVRLIGEVFGLDLPQGEKLVMLALADFASDEGYAWPSVSRVAWKTGYTRRSIQRVLRRLEEAGLVSRLEEGGGPGRTAAYRISPEKGVKLSPFEAWKGDICDTARATPATCKGDTGVALSVIEPSVEPSEKRDSLQPLKDALVQAWGVNPSEITDWGPVQAAAAKLRKVGATPKDVIARGNLYRLLGWNEKGSRPSPSALAKHWAACVPALLEPVDRKGLDRELAQRAQERQLREVL